MFDGRGRGGPKPSKWRKAASSCFTAFFAVEAGGGAQASNSETPAVDAVDLPSAPVEAPREELHGEVEELVAVRTTKKDGRMYLVKWEGWAAKHNTWEPVCHLPPQLIKEFEADRVGNLEATSDESDGEADEAVEPQPADAPAAESNRKANRKAPAAQPPAAAPKPAAASKRKAPAAQPPAAVPKTAAASNRKAPAAEPPAAAPKRAAASKRKEPAAQREPPAAARKKPKPAAAPKPAASPKPAAAPKRASAGSKRKR